MTEKIRWGILSTGSIANSFAEDIHHVADAEVIAVGSRSQKNANLFAKKHNIPRFYGSYAELANDPDVDVVYIATPHAFHAEHSILCMQAGKHVLCEKAFSITAAEAEEMIAVARRRKVFLMEALVTRHFPVSHKVLQWVNDGLIGDVRIVQANRCVRGTFRPEQRHLNPGLGGGSLLDVGIYVIGFALMIYRKKPDRAVGYGHVAEFGSDEQGATLLEYDDGALAVLTFALRTDAVNEAHICGTKGHIKIPELFAVPTKAVLCVEGQDEIAFEKKITGNGLHYQVHEVHRCLRADLLESPRMPLEESLQIMQTMDEIRAPWPFRYPNDA